MISLEDLGAFYYQLEDSKMDKATLNKVKAILAQFLQVTLYDWEVAQYDPETGEFVGRIRMKSKNDLFDDDYQIRIETMIENGENLYLTVLFKGLPDAKW